MNVRATWGQTVVFAAPPKIKTGVTTFSPHTRLEIVILLRKRQQKELF